MPHTVTAQEDEAAAQSNPYIKTSGLPVPRFISLASNKVFMRTGPGLRYPIRWVYKQKNMPIEVIQEFDTWRKVRDVDGQEGWVHQSLLSGRRTAYIQEEKGAILLRKAKTDAQPLAILENRVLVTLEECEKDWCRARVDNFKGWIEKKSLWGVYGQEELD
ncbi:MAG: SH3 domain-containing protein [Pseudomonadota bacterium]